MEKPTSLDGVGSLNLLPLPVNKGKQRRGKLSGKDSVIPNSSNRDGKRKRGRPAGKIVKGRNVIQARRTRPRLGKIASKISENETEDSGSSDEKMNDEENDTTPRNEGIHGMAGNENSEIQQTRLVDNLDLSCRSKTVEHVAAEDCRSGEFFDKAPEIKTNKLLRGNSGKLEKWEASERGERHHGQGSEKPEKLEVTVDPVQAMLMDMLPSLGMKKAENKNPIIEEEKQSMDSNVEIVEVVKKKKVSYKDVAGELLKDW